MFGSAILDTVIGVLFMYLLISLACSSLQELLESILRYRARDLERALREMLNDPTGGLVAKFYNHPIISSLYRGKYLGSQGVFKNLPSYISTRHAAITLLDILAPDDVAAGSRGTAKLIGDSMTPIVVGIPATLQKARLSLEERYDETMNRASGWYKRRAQWVIAGIAMVIVVVLNADTVAWLQPAQSREPARNSLVVLASRFVASDSSHQIAPLSELAAAIAHQSSLPLGWNGFAAEKLPGNVVGWIEKIAGWLITIAAVSLGAPFWFDILNRVIMFRSSARPPENPAVTSGSPASEL